MGSVSIRETLLVMGVLALAGLITVAVVAHDGGPRTRWRTDLRSPITAGPALDGGVLFVGTEGGSVVAMDAHSGAVSWRTPVSAPARGAIRVTPEVIVFGTDDDILHAADRRGGRLRWSASVARAVGVPVVFEGLVVAATRTGDVVAFDLETGSERWRTALGRRIEADVATTGDSIVVGDISGRLHTLDGQSGALLESIQVAGVIRGPAAAAAAADGRAFVILGSDPVVVALGARGLERWRVETGGPTRQPPVILGGIALVDASPDLLALDLETGAELWRYTARAIVLSFGAADGLAIAGMHTGDLDAIDVSDRRADLALSHQRTDSHPAAGGRRHRHGLLRGTGRRRVCSRGPRC